MGEVVGAAELEGWETAPGLETAPSGGLVWAQQCVRQWQQQDSGNEQQRNIRCPGVRQWHRRVQRELKEDNTINRKQ